MAHCHCSMCRKFHGAAFSTYGEAKIENFKWLQGEGFLKLTLQPMVQNDNFVVTVDLV